MIRLDGLVSAGHPLRSPKNPHLRNGTVNNTDEAQTDKSWGIFRCIGNARLSVWKKPPHPEKKIGQSTSPLLPMPDSEHTDDTDPEQKRREQNGTTLTLEEWFEELNKHDSFDQYAKKRRKKSSERC